MADMNSEYGNGEQDDAPHEAQRDRNRLLMVLAIALVVLITVLVLLMLRGCGSILNSASRRSATNQIVPVAGRPPLEGQVSLWLASGTDLRQTLSEASVSSERIVDMGGGRFVVFVTPGREVDVVRRLRDVGGVYDAGRVYAGEAKPAP